MHDIPLIRSYMTPQESVNYAGQLLTERLDMLNRQLQRKEERREDFNQWDLIARNFAIESVDLSSTAAMSPLEQFAHSVCDIYNDGGHIEQVGDLDFYTVHLYRDDYPGTCRDEGYASVDLPLTGSIAIFDQLWREGNLYKFLSQECRTQLGLTGLMS